MSDHRTVHRESAVAWTHVTVARRGPASVTSGGATDGTNSGVLSASDMSMSQLSYSAGVSCRSTKPARSSSGITSRSPCRSDTSAPLLPIVTDTAPHDIVISPSSCWTVTGAPAPPVDAPSARAQPNGGTSACAGPSGVSTTPRNRTDDGLATWVPPPAVPSRPGSTAPISAATAECSASASRWTHAIDDPGMMSWNCCVRTRCHHASMSEGLVPASAAHASVSWSSCSLRLLPCLVPTCVL